MDIKDLEDVTLENVLAFEKNPQPAPAPEDPVEPVDPVEPQDPPVDPEPENPENPEEPENPADPEDPTDSEETESRIVDDIIDSFGYEGIDKENYEDDENGFKKLATDLSSRLAEERLKELLSKDELIAKHFEYKMLGGDSKTFLETMYPKNDFSSIEITEEDEASQDKALKTYFNLKGFTPEESNELIKDIEVAGQKFERAKSAKTAIDSHNASQKEALIENQRRQKEQQEQQAREQIENVTRTIKEASDFKGIAIKESEKTEFIDYLTRPVNGQGQTQRELDAMKAGTDERLLVDLLMYKKFNLQEFIETKAKTTNARGLRKNVGKTESKKPSSATKSSNGYEKNPNLESIDFKKLFGN